MPLWVGRSTDTRNRVNSAKSPVDRQMANRQTGSTMTAGESSKREILVIAEQKRPRHALAKLERSSSFIFYQKSVFGALEDFRYDIQYLEQFSQESPKRKKKVPLLAQIN